MIEQRALTLRGEGLIRAFSSKLKVYHPILDTQNLPDLASECVGIWDTGASGSVITQKVIDDLELKPTGMTQVRTAGGSHRSPVFLVDFLLPNGVHIAGLDVTLGKIEGIDVLIGMDVINFGDFSITNHKGKTIMSFRTPSCIEIDYVKDINRKKVFGVGHGRGTSKKKPTHKKNKKNKRKK